MIWANRHGSEVIQHEEFCNLDAVMLGRFLAEDDLQCEEIELFKALVK